MPTIHRFRRESFVTVNRILTGPSFQAHLLAADAFGRYPGAEVVTVYLGQHKTPAAMRTAKSKQVVIAIDQPEQSGTLEQWRIGKGCATQPLPFSPAD